MGLFLSQALHQLRKRRTLQRQIEKKSSCVETLHDTIHRIEDSTSNEMVSVVVSDCGIPPPPHPTPAAPTAPNENIEFQSCVA